MGKRADRDKVGTLEASSGMRASVTPPDISVFARTAAAPHGLAHVIDRHVFEQQDIGNRPRAPDRPARAFRFTSITAFAPHARTCETAFAMPPPRSMWLSLIITPSFERHAMVRGTAHPHAVFLEVAQRRRRFSGIENRDGSTAGARELTRQGGDAR